MEYSSKQRRSWMAAYNETRNISQTCREFGITRSTFYKWFERYDSDSPSKPLRSKSRKPHRTRKSTR
ncbi:MAG: helix-turn-helix domain-containing protein, partial [Chloroflexi bacterium]|nr:helix-turn-helix domain-containing protein [Chloroflexota bacterium]